MRSIGSRISDGERGQIAPLLLMIMFSVLLLAVLLGQVGFATDLKGQSQTSADAAALAGEQNVKQQYLALLLANPEGVTPEQVNWGLVTAAAENYAEQNGGHIVHWDHQGWDYRVIVRSNKGLEGKDAQKAGVAGTHFDTKGRATMVQVFSLSSLGGGTLGPGGGALGGNNHIPADELKDIAKQAGVPILPDSALRVDGGSGNGGSPDVEDLTTQMKVGIARAEHLLGHPLPITSAFRTAAYQAQVCETHKVCAAPGRSMHQFGMAIDVGDTSELSALIASRPKYFGMCWPNISQDPVHFSQLGDVECNGTAGAGGGGGVPVGGFGIGTFDIHLVDYDNPPQLGLPGLGGGPAMPPTLSQIQVAQIIAGVGKQLGVDCKVMLSAFETAAVESGFANLDHGDRDSLGVFQQRASWGSVSSRLNVGDSATRYLLQAMAEERRNPGEPAWLIAANVQRPQENYRYKYGVDPWYSEAVQLLHKVGITNCP